MGIPYQVLMDYFDNTPRKELSSVVILKDHPDMANWVCNLIDLYAVLPMSYKSWMHLMDKVTANGLMHNARVSGAKVIHFQVELKDSSEHVELDHATIYAGVALEAKLYNKLDPGDVKDIVMDMIQLHGVSRPRRDELIEKLRRLHALSR